MRFEIYPDARGEWRWRLRAANGHDVIADSGEGYVNKNDCLHGIGLVMSTTNQTPIVEVAS